MAILYPSWIEIPVYDLDRALAFYRAVFELEDTPLYHEPPTEIRVLLNSEKEIKKPGVSLIKSPVHTPSGIGAQVNFHIGSYAALQKALDQVVLYGGTLDTTLVEMEDGVRYITLLDSEGNRIALSAYEEE